MFYVVLIVCICYSDVLNMVVLSYWQDPEFFQYLKENDKELLEFNVADTTVRFLFFCKK